MAGGLQLRQHLSLWTYNLQRTQAQPLGVGCFFRLVGYFLEVLCYFTHIICLFYDREGPPWCSATRSLEPSRGATLKSCWMEISSWLGTMILETSRAGSRTARHENTMNPTLYNLRPCTHGTCLESTFGSLSFGL